MPTSAPVYVVKASPYLRESYRELQADFYTYIYVPIGVTKEHLTLVYSEASMESPPRPDTIFVGNDQYYIVATSDNGFFVGSCENSNDRVRVGCYTPCLIRQSSWQ